MTYEELKQALLDFPVRGGEPMLESYAETLIQLGEDRINQDLRLQGHIVSLEVPNPGGAYNLPDDCLELDRVAGPGGESLKPRPADELVTWGNTPLLPCFYAVDGRRLIFSPEVDSITLRYYKQLPRLKEAGSHWLFAQAPNLYLYAALCEVGIFDLGEDREQNRYETAYQRIVLTLRETDWEVQHPRSQPPRTVINAGRKSRVTL